jgi:general secretion pathway protein A
MEPKGDLVYLSFFGLAEHPFRLAPDPRFLFLSASHREALAGLEARRGLAVVTGEAGIGKTSLLLALRDRLGANTAVAYVYNTTLKFDGVVEFLLEDLGIAKPEESPERRLAALSDFLGERERAGQNTTLIFDEAQSLDARALDQIGRLSKLESGSPGKHLQIVLVGGPELEDTLEHHPEIQIGFSCRLRPLDAEEVHAYIRHHLQVAGAPDPGLFSERAIRRITQNARGIPRVINLLCDHCLLFAYADHKRRIDRHIANHAIAYLSTGGQAFRQAARGWRLAKVAGIALASALAGFALSLLAGRS